MALWGAPRRKKNGAPGGIALKPCGEGCQKSTSSGGSARCRKCENQPQSVLAMKVIVVVVIRDVTFVPIALRSCEESIEANCCVLPRARRCYVVNYCGHEERAPPRECEVDWPQPLATVARGQSIALVHDVVPALSVDLEFGHRSISTAGIRVDPVPKAINAAEPHRIGDVLLALE